MVNKILFLSVALFGFLLTGCAEYWYQEGRSFKQCQQDHQACFSELKKRTDFVGSMDYEFEFMTQCMTDKGYRLVKENELPLDAKRNRPDSTIHWKAKGIAGHIEE